MLLKYKDFAITLSKDEMKQVKGGTGQSRACLVRSDCGTDTCDPPHDSDGLSHWDCVNFVCKFQVCP
jgi:hypothetical protein